MQIDFKLAVPVLTLRHRSISISDLFIPIFTRGHTVAIFCTTSGSFFTHIYEQKGVSSVPNRCTWYLTQRCATIRITQYGSLIQCIFDVNVQLFFVTDAFIKQSCPIVKNLANCVCVQLLLMHSKVSVRLIRGLTLQDFVLTISQDIILKTSSPMLSELFQFQDTI